MFVAPLAGSAGAVVAALSVPSGVSAGVSAVVWDVVSFVSVVGWSDVVVCDASEKSSDAGSALEGSAFEVSDVSFWFSKSAEASVAAVSAGSAAVLSSGSAGVPVEDLSSVFVVSSVSAMDSVSALSSVNSVLLVSVRAELVAGSMVSADVVLAGVVPAWEDVSVPKREESSCEPVSALEAGLKDVVSAAALAAGS